MLTMCYVVRTRQSFRFSKEAYCILYVLKMATELCCLLMNEILMPNNNDKELFFSFASLMWPTDLYCVSELRFILFAIYKL